MSPSEFCLLFISFFPTEDYTFPVSLVMVAEDCFVGFSLLDEDVGG